MARMHQADSDTSWVVVAEEECAAVAPEKVLHPEELARYRREGAAPAAEFLRGRYAVKLLIEERQNRPMNEVLITADAAGKPHLERDSRFFCSISDKDGYSAAAISPRPVGIDIERVAPRHSALLRHIASEEECERVRSICSEEELTTFLWTCKEAAAKADERIHPLARYTAHTEGGLSLVRGSATWKAVSLRRGEYRVTLAVAA